MPRPRIQPTAEQDSNGQNAHEISATGFENSSVTINGSPLPPDDNAFRIFGLFHSYHVISVASVVSLVLILSVYLTAMFLFPWVKYDTLFCVIAASGFTIFLFTGMGSNALVFKALFSNTSTYVTPFLLYHAFVLLVEAIITFAALGQIISDQDAHLDESDILARQVVTLTPLCAIFQVAMIYIGYKYIQYIKNYAYFRQLANSINPVMTFNDPIFTPPADETTIKP
uniref:MARVEL domain-containing protein n=1 Tax=Panagrellus redivivus TaxID=6233 RepID=A0A7E4ZTJ2_PANRE